MDICVKLSDIIMGMECQSDDSSSYLNKKTGEIVMVMGEELRAVEDGDSLEGYPEWQQEAIKIAQDVFESYENYVELPSKFDIHEYRIMERFCLSIEDEQISDSLYYAIKGKGAFRRFKNGIYRFGVAEDWYEYWERAFTRIAKEWCEANTIEYIDDSRDNNRNSHI